MSKREPKVPQVSKAPKVRINRCVTLIIKPLRIFQFIMVLLIFVLVIYVIASNSTELSTVSCILLIILSGVYVFVLAVDLISQISGGEMQAIPMFVFSLSGVLLFGIAGILLLITYRTNATWYIWMTLIFSLLLCALFIFDVVMLLAFWRRRCELCKRCCVADQSQILFQRNEHCHPRCPETVKYDLTTSISNIRVSSGDEERTPDHSHRKVGYGRRRQYVDCPTSTRSVPVLDIAQVQTEPNATSTIESQTRKSEVKEIPVQTVSRCELCNRQIQFYDTSDSVMSPMAQHQAPCTPCPAFVQLIRGGTCCPGCKCVAGIVQVQQMQRKPSDGHQRKSHKKSETDEQVQWIQEVDPNTHGMLTSEKSRIGQVASNGVNLKTNT